MKTEKEILTALKTLMEVCEDNKGQCNKCVLRNGDGWCAVLSDSNGECYSNIQKWDLKRDDLPRLILN